jgi:tetratricopeptide (TPR) repeat protein
MTIVHFLRTTIRDCEGAAVSARSRVRRQMLIRHAEGYLELGLPEHALAELARWDDQAETLPDHALYLKGEALRELGKHHEAVGPLSRAAEGAPENIHIWLALGWCYKRIGRLDLAIESLEEALEAKPNEAILHYNLACYWSLAGNKRQSLLFLSQALDLDPNYRDLVGAESDFDNVRGDPAFRALTSVVV